MIHLRSSTPNPEKKNTLAEINERGPRQNLPLPNCDAYLLLLTASQPPPTLCGDPIFLQPPRVRTYTHMTDISRILTLSYHDEPNELIFSITKHNSRPRMYSGEELK